MWMCYEEASLPKAVDLETTIDRLMGELNILCRELELAGNRHDAFLDSEWRVNRMVNFGKSTQAIVNYKERKLSLEELMGVLHDQNTKGYVEIDHLPHHIVKKFKLEAESEESVVENVGNVLFHLDTNPSLQDFPKDEIKYIPVYILKTKISPSDLRIIWPYLSEERQVELELYRGSHCNEPGEEDHIDGPPPCKKIRK